MAKRLRAAEQGDLFRIGPFVVSNTGLRVNGRPPAERWEVALVAISQAREGVQWAIGDMLAYADERVYPVDLVERAAGATGYKRGTLQNLKSLSKTFPVGTPTRGILSWSHHALVAGFEVAERDELLRRAATEGLTWEMLQAETRTLRHARRVSELLWPDDTYGALLVDCPWEHEAGALPPTRATENHYDTMPTDQICALAPRVQAITAPSAVMYFWSTTAKLVSGEATQVMRAWGFEPRSAHVWVKEHMGLGYWVRNRHEHLCIATRGTPPSPEESLRPDSVIDAARGLHSEKPVEAYEIIERCYPTYPRVELFARPPFRQGWDHWGNELLERVPERATRVREEEEVPI